jgi:hypothetical protein
VLCPAVTAAALLIVIESGTSCHDLMVVRHESQTADAMTHTKQGEIGFVKVAPVFDVVKDHAVTPRLPPVAPAAT